MISKDEALAATGDLDGFYHRTREFLEGFRKDPELFAGVADPRFHEDFASAWDEYSAQDTFAEDLAQINRASPSALYRAGLYGRQLKLKLRVIGDWLRRWGAERAKKVLVKVLESIDTLLDSAIDALGLGHAMKELKDVLLNLISA